MILSISVCEEELAKIAPAVKLTDEQASTVHALCMGKDCYYIMPTGELLIGFPISLADYGGLNAMVNNS